MKDSTHTIYWPIKRDWHFAIYRPDEKTLKKYWKIGIKLSINDNTKSSQIYTLLQFLSMPKNICGIY